MNKIKYWVLVFYFFAVSNHVACYNNCEELCRTRLSSIEQKQTVMCDLLDGTLRKAIRTISNMDHNHYVICKDYMHNNYIEHIFYDNVIS